MHGLACLSVCGGRGLAFLVPVGSSVSAVVLPRFCRSSAAASGERRQVAGMKKHAAVVRHTKESASTALRERERKRIDGAAREKEREKERTHRRREEREREEKREREREESA